MGAGGAAIAGSLGQGLQNYMLSKEQATPATRDYLTGAELWSLLPPTARSLYGEAGLSPEARYPVELVDNYLGLIGTLTRLSQPTETGSAQGWAPEQFAALYDWAARGGQGPIPAEVGFVPYSTGTALLQQIGRGQTGSTEPKGWTPEQFSALRDWMAQGGQGPLPETVGMVPYSQGIQLLEAATQQEPQFMVTPPQAVREAFGLPEQISAEDLGTLASAAERLAGAGFQVAPQEEPIYYVVEPDDPEIGWQLIDHFDVKPGQRIPLDQALAMVDFVDKYLAMTGRAVDVQQKLLELKKAEHRWANSLVPVDELRQFWKNLDLPGEPIIRDLDGDGKVLWEDWLNDNEKGLQLYRSATEIDRIVEDTESIRLDNAIKRVDLDYAPIMNDLAVRQLTANVQIDEARAAQIVEELGLNRQRTQAEINRLLQEMEQGKTAFEVEMEYKRELINKLRAEGRLTEAEAKEAETIAGLNALLLEYKVREAQLALGPVQAEALWITLGLDGEHSPSGVKLFRGNVEPMVNFMEANVGKVVTARDLFMAAGIDLKQIPKEALDKLITIDEPTIQNVRIVTGLGVEKEDIADSIDLLIKLAQLVSPYLSNNLNAQIIAASGIARTNPEMAASLLRSPLADLAQEFERLFPGSEVTVNDILDSILQGVGEELGIGRRAATNASSAAMSFAMESVARAGGSPERALQILRANKDMMLNDPESPAYQNEALYNEILSILQSMTGGGS